MNVAQAMEHRRCVKDYEPNHIIAIQMRAVSLRQYGLGDGVLVPGTVM